VRTPLSASMTYGDEYRLLVEAVVDYAIFVIDTAGHVVTWNRGAERIIGYTADEIVGRDFSVFYPEEERRAGRPARELEIASRDGRYEEEGLRVRKDGSRFWALVVLTAIRDDRGELVGFAKVTRDLTATKQQEETARQLAAERAARKAAERAEAQLQTILEGLGEGIMVLDRTGAPSFVNSAAARTSGFGTPEALLATPTAELVSRFELTDENGHAIPSEQLPSCRALAGEVPEPIALGIRERATGRNWWAFMRATPVFDDQGNVELVVIVWRDITERHREDEARRYLYETTATLSASLEYEVTLTALARMLVPHLADWCAIDVFEEGELKRLAVAHVDPAKVVLAGELGRRYPVDLSDNAQGLGRVLRTGEPQLYPEITDDMLTESARDDEHLALSRTLGFRSAMVVPVRARDVALGAMTLISAESGRRYDQRDLALATELGRRAGIAIENARLYRDAQRAVMLRDDFLLIAGHELRTPLTALDLHLQGLRKALTSGNVATDVPKWTERVTKTLAHSRRLNSLITELLDVSRISSGHLELHHEHFDLQALVSEVVERHSELAARAGSTIGVTTSGDTYGEWDRARLDQVVSNLLDNAVKYGCGKPITIELHGDGNVSLSVRDRGMGIPTNDQQRIFGRFERAVSSRHYGGLGLGLWIAREIVHAHGGEIRFESTPGETTVFKIDLPKRR